MFKIYPYNIASASVKKLKRGLDAVLIKPENSQYRHRDSNVVINWGNSTRIPNLIGVPIINSPEAVAVAVNKLTTLQVLEEENVPHIPFTTDRNVAQQWNKVFVRHNLKGHSGEGIEVIESTVTQRELPIVSELNEIFDEYYNSTDDEDDRNIIQELQATLDEVAPTPTNTITLPDAPLYTKGILNNGEYRVHVFQGEVILYQKKSRRVDEETGEVITAEGEDADVRNLASNWIYRTGNLNRLDRVEALAIDAIDALGLDFGAVDIIMDIDGNVYVLEINSAPGLGNTDTLEAYTNAFNNLG